MKIEIHCEFNFHCSGSMTWRSKCVDHVMLASAANLADRDPAEHVVAISRREGEGRIEK